MNAMDVVLILSASMLGVAAVLMVARVTMGPTVLDRSAALDVLMSVMVCAVSLWAVYQESTVVLPMLLVLAMLGFVGSVAIARFASGVDDVEAERDDRDDRDDRGERA